MKRDDIKPYLAGIYQAVKAGSRPASDPHLDPAFHPIYQRCAPFTMTTVERMYGLWSAVEYVHRQNVEGAFVECGVWRGGSSMLMALTLADVGDTTRPLWLYDTFTGMSTPTERDATVDGARVLDRWDKIRNDESGIMAVAQLGEVRANMASTGIDDSRVRYVRGKVEDTIPDEAPPDIALLRLDTDWYESTRHELEHLWPRVRQGGVLIIDDYGHWRGARDAVDEFFRNREDAPLLTPLDYTGRLGVRAFRPS